MREAKKTWKEIAVTFGVVQSTMTIWVRGGGQIPEKYMKPVRKDAIDIEPLIDMVKEGKLSQSEMGMRLGIKANAVAKRIKRHDIRALAGVPDNKKPEQRNKYSDEDLALIESYLKEGYSWNQTAKILKMDHRSIRNNFPQYRENGREAQRVKMYEYHMSKKIEEAWGRSRAA